MRRVLLLLLLVCSALVARADEPRREYRGYWIDTFNTPLATKTDVERIIDSAVRSNANALFVQVRRRADSWYIDSAEPLTEVPGVGDPEPDGHWTFDPLRSLIQQAHRHAIEVHAFVIVGAIYRLDPRTEGLPQDPRHAFLQHVWDAEAGRPYSGERQWATRSLPHNLRGTTFGGQRFGPDWYIDLGHPEAAAYTVDVLLHLIRTYDIDGLHLDRVRYPEAPIDSARGQRMGINIGYNEVSVARFTKRYGSRASYYDASDVGRKIVGHTITSGDVGYPRTNDPLWNDWRREQVTNFVRRLYLNATSLKPAIKVSAALISWSEGPAASGGFLHTDPYTCVFQDWSGWLRDGILDLASPMMYKREHTSRERRQFNDWLSFVVTTAHDAGRLAVPGLGAYMNAIEGTLRQARRARTAGADGVVFFAMGDTSPQSKSNSTNRGLAKNPYASNRATPKRTNNEFFSALRTGSSTDGKNRFEEARLSPLFGSSALTPIRPPETTGAVMGTAIGSSGEQLDGYPIEINGAGSTRTILTDGSGFFGALRLPPGHYRALVHTASGTFSSCPFMIEAGAVTRTSIASHSACSGGQESR
ncbi:MAG: family 10 glycosylhydrolase [Thermoanaerobaculia bacterium]